jgi:hypothetical protein
VTVTVTVIVTVTVTVTVTRFSGKLEASDVALIIVFSGLE